MKNTLKNLAQAFIGESQARNRYTFYAQKAKKEGFEQIAAIFLTTANQEKEHAHQLFKLINQLKKDNKPLRVFAPAPTLLGNTKTNLKAALEGENYEHTQMYPNFAQEAEKEGLKKIAQRLRAIAKAEEHHAERYKKLLKEVEKRTVFKKEKKVWWTCRECGYHYFGFKPPQRCPSCNHPQAFYQKKCEEY